MSDDALAPLRQRLGLGPDDPCPSPDAFAYAEKIIPKRGYYELDGEDGTIGIYDKRCEIVTVVPPNFDPYEPIPCHGCDRPMQPMSLKCRNCGSPIDPVYVWEYLAGEEETGEAGDLASGVRLAWLDDTPAAEEFVSALREAGVHYQLREDDDDGLGRTGTSIWVPVAELGAAQNATARPGVEGG